MRADVPILDKEIDRFPEGLFELADSDQSAGWHLLYTRSRREKDLMRRLLAMEIPFYGPCVMRRSRSPGGRVRKSWVPLFSNYVFLLGGLSEVQAAWKTNCLSSVTLASDKSALGLDLRRLSMLIQCEAPVRVEDKLQPGELVRVRSGPFKGCEGVVCHRRAQGYLAVNVTFAQRSVLIEFDCFLVEPV